ncbi:MAG: C39 family peptidase [Clostridia bacterium]|nr:C39 family peptidase [Clostridia bacterium]
MKKLFFILIILLLCGALAFALITSESWKKEIILYDVPTYCQFPDYPNGCESAALYMLLSYYHVNITMEEIVAQLPKGPVPYQIDGITYGPDPERVYVGDPRRHDGWGCYEGPIRQTAEHFKKGAVSKNGAGYRDIVRALEHGSPVIAWFTTKPDTHMTDYVSYEWIDEETGRTITYPPKFHAILIFGCDGTHIYYNDPYTGSTMTMDYKYFEDDFQYMGSRIVYYE